MPKLTQTELNNKYSKNLHVSSNSSVIVQRDQASNLDPNLDNYIYMEPVNWIYDNASVNTFINTRFTYFKFPPKTTIEDIVVPVDTVIDEVYVEVPNTSSINTNSGSMRINFSSRYQPEQQKIPTIQLLLPGSTQINYGWNELITEEVFNAIKAENFYDPVVWDAAQYNLDLSSDDPVTVANAWNNAQRKYIAGVTTRLATSPYNTTYAKPYDTVESKLKLVQFQKSKYFRAHERARQELADANSSGRYKLGDNPQPSINGYGYYNTSSLFEGHFKPINFKVIDGNSLFDGSTFNITQDLIDSKNPYEFNVQLAVSHLDNHARNCFAIRLIKYTDKSTVKQPYQVVKTISSATQGYGYQGNKENGSESLLANLKILRTELDSLELSRDQLISKQALLLSEANKYNQQAVDLQNNGKTYGTIGFVDVIIYPNEQISKYEQRAKLQKEVTGLYNELVKKRDEANNARKTAASEQATIENKIKTVTAQYENAPKNFTAQKQIILDPYKLTVEQIMDPNITFLWPGKTFFKLNHIVQASDMQLHDRYVVEMLALEPQEIPHELIEENSYWDITEIVDAKQINNTAKFNINTAWTGYVDNLKYADVIDDNTVIPGTGDVVDSVSVTVVDVNTGGGLVSDNTTGEYTTKTSTTTTSTNKTFGTVTKTVTDITGSTKDSAGVTTSKITNNIINTKNSSFS